MRFTILSNLLLSSIGVLELQLATASDASGDWQQFFGPHPDNVSTDTGLLTECPDEGPSLLWKASGMGTGITPVSISAGRVFTVGNRSDTDVLIAFDVGTGREL